MNGGYSVTMVKSPGVSEVERRKRLSRVYSMLIELGREANDDTPASEAREPGAGASSGQRKADRQGQCTPEPAAVQIGGAL